MAESKNRTLTTDHAVDAARAGEPAGFDALFRAWGGPLVSFARARNAPDPEGICNEAFLRAFRSMESFDGDGAAFRRWIFSIARNLLIDGHRARQRRPDELFAPPPEQESPAAEDLAMENLANTEIAALLAGLTDEQREVIVLRLVADLSLADTAEIVGRPVSAVKRLQARALRRIQTDILEKGVSS